MNTNQAKIGAFLLFPPTVLWLLIILFMFDNTLANYFFASINLQILDFLFYIAGLIFPAAALVVGIGGVLQKQQKSYNFIVIAISALMLTLMGLMVFVF